MKRIASVSVHTLYIPEEHLAADVIFYFISDGFHDIFVPKSQQIRYTVMSNIR